MGMSETSENNKSKYLKTHYYNNTYGDVKKAIFSFFKARNAIIVDCNDEYQEMLVKDFFCEINIKIYSVDELKCAIDLKTIAPIFLTGKGLIKKLYLYLDEVLKG